MSQTARAQSLRRKKAADHPPLPTALCLDEYLPPTLRRLKNPQTEIPRIAKNPGLTSELEGIIQRIPTRHRLIRGDARALSLASESVQLILTSPPYWNLKDYPDSPGQMGNLADYDLFLVELDRIWRSCFDVLVPGGRVVIVVGDVCLSRKKNNGRHTVIPLHAAIQEHCRRLGFDNLAPIIWHKIANVTYEVDNGSGFLGKPFEPNAVIKNDIEYILMQRKPGGYRQPSEAARILSVIPEEKYHRWFQQIWSGVTGASTRLHPAPYPIELAERLVRMFSFVGDTVLDPFLGTGTTSLAAARWGRHSVGCEVNPKYLAHAEQRIREGLQGLFSDVDIRIEEQNV